MDDHCLPSMMTSTMPRFLVRSAVARGDRVQLDAPQAKHLRVRRLRQGDEVVLFDGAGHSYLASVDRISRHAVEVLIVERLRDRVAESPLDLILAVAVLKADRLEWVIEKATELGVHRLRPFVSQHSLARPSPARRKRWQEIALSAAKQSGRTVVPAVEAPVDFETILAEATPRSLLFWERAGQSGDLAELGGPPATITVIIGPEGGFADAEVEAARAAGSHIVGLGPRILRAETAAIVALTLCQSRWGDLGQQVLT